MYSLMKNEDYIDATMMSFQWFNNDNLFLFKLVDV